MKADGVFEGGGIKAIGFLGAIAEMEARGYSWEKLAGTSAGSVVAALLAAGYRSEEMVPIFFKLNYLMLVARRGLAKIPVVGAGLQLLLAKGLHPSSRIEAFIGQLLKQKGIQSFGDLPRDKLRIVASDVTSGKMLMFPDDIAQFGIDPQTMPIAKAVRMSCSIPYYFEPVKLTAEGVTHYVVDGGLLSNYPIWLFDVPGTPRWPTFGFRFGDEQSLADPQSIRGLISYTKAVVTTMLDAQDQVYVKRPDAVRTIFIPTFKIKATQFHISQEQKEMLYESGKAATKAFFLTWDFEEYCKQYRNNQ
ncbi:phospholipase [Brevibacillus fluminis]|uniref:Phospholipase n=1 Tax=Brevibacillus fluminis TaxID=511487 RepID=A0A3M8CZD9_9BACL|nr:patatin-like phospholipase family protein [Brevibacillus fluminis]RNB81164.1 phospholipase [Brevibacillus fluminis]